MAARTKDELIEGMTLDIGEFATDVEIVAWLRREIHACLVDALTGDSLANRMDRNTEIAYLYVIAIDTGNHESLAAEFDDPAR
jgi:hypothetical protein